MRNIGRKFLFNLCPLFFVDEVRFGDGQHTVFHQQFGIVFLQFAQEHLVSFCDVRFIGGHHEQEDGVAFDMPEEAHTDAFSFMGAFDDAGDVGHHEGAVVIIADDAQVGFQRGKRVIRDFGFGRCDGGQQRGFAGVGEAHEADVGQHFQFQDEPAFFSVLAGLGVVGRLVGGTLEMVVSPAALAAATKDEFLVFFDQFGDDFFGFGIFHNDALGHFQDDVGPVFAPFEGFGAVPSVLGTHHFTVAQMNERPKLRVHPKDDVSAAPAVTAVGTALWDIFCPVQVGASCSSVPAGAEDAYVVYEIAFGHDSDV